mmetsp:Transcript_9960/g.31615  ORF Transcript_9960/g.31615 Transcript_9960/m.31615 type:complete len:241 (-) Transcript_9960:473-1195(-)
MRSTGIRSNGAVRDADIPAGGAPVPEGDATEATAAAAAVAAAASCKRSATVWATLRSKSSPTLCGPSSSSVQALASSTTAPSTAEGACSSSFVRVAVATPRVLGSSALKSRPASEPNVEVLPARAWPTKQSFTERSGCLPSAKALRKAATAPGPWALRSSISLWRAERSSPQAECTSPSSGCSCSGSASGSISVACPWDGLSDPTSHSAESGLIIACASGVSARASIRPSRACSSRSFED